LLENLFEISCVKLALDDVVVELKSINKPIIINTAQIILNATVYFKASQTR